MATFTTLVKIYSTNNGVSEVIGKNGQGSKVLASVAEWCENCHTKVRDCNCYICFSRKCVIWSLLDLPQFLSNLRCQILKEASNFWCFRCICRAKSEYDEYREKFRLFDSALFCMPPDHRLRRFCNKVLTSQLDAPIGGQTMESQELKVFFAARFKFIIWWVKVSMN
jgi:hypothetical protein